MAVCICMCSLEEGLFFLPFVWKGKKDPVHPVNPVQCLNQLLREPLMTILINDLHR